MYSSISQIEPLLLAATDPRWSELVSKAERLREVDAALSAQVHPTTCASVANLVRQMNCYYSNLIEGHRTLPLDIERAVAADYSSEPERRDQQLLAVAHVAAEAELAAAPAPTIAEVVNPGAIAALHESFFRRLPESMLQIEGGQRLVPGQFRQANVEVGKHVAPKHEAVPAFLDRFATVYGGLPSVTASIPQVMAAHHRFAWIHPFMDGNGRVCRLLTQRMLVSLGINKSGVWALSRGLARGENYKAFLAYADSPRQGDLDGRGNLSSRALAEFVDYMLETAIDQVVFMSSILELDRLRERIRRYFSEARLDLRPEATHLVEAAIAFGSVSRGEVGRITGLGGRIAGDVLGQLLDEGFLLPVESEAMRGPVKAGFPAKALGWWLPGLYPAGSLEEEIAPVSVRKFAARPRR